MLGFVKSFHMGKYVLHVWISKSLSDVNSEHFQHENGFQNTSAHPCAQLVFRITLHFQETVCVNIKLCTEHLFQMCADY